MILDRCDVRRRDEGKFEKIERSLSAVGLCYLLGAGVEGGYKLVSLGRHRYLVGSAYSS